MHFQSLAKQAGGASEFTQASALGSQCLQETLAKKTVSPWLLRGQPS